jgi:hypothetical protein
MAPSPLLEPLSLQHKCRKLGAKITWSVGAQALFHSFSFSFDNFWDIAQGTDASEKFDWFLNTYMKKESEYHSHYGRLTERTNTGGTWRADTRFATQEIKKLVDFNGSIYGLNLYRIPGERFGSLLRRVHNLFSYSLDNDEHTFKPTILFGAYTNDYYGYRRPWGHYFTIIRMAEIDDTDNSFMAEIVDPIDGNIHSVKISETSNTQFARKWDIYGIEGLLIDTAVTLPSGQTVPNSALKIEGIEHIHGSTGETFLLEYGLGIYAPDDVMNSTYSFERGLYGGM